MKVILSRKGFDSENGSAPSPIFTDGTMFSIPIPSSNGPTSYDQIIANGRSIGPIVESLTNGRYLGSSRTHFDPDLDYGAMHRRSGWLPAFGQVSSSLSHLDKQGISIGDLFLFFGWFRDVEETDNNAVQIADGSRNIHAMFGWLQVGEIIDVGNATEDVLATRPWLAQHPHVNGISSKQNKIYIASNQLTLPLCNRDIRLPGGGVFKTIAKSRILTHPGQEKRTMWMLPEEFSPENGLATLTYHGSAERWQPSPMPGKALLQSVSKGQEFVLHVSDEAVLRQWLSGIFFGV